MKHFPFCVSTHETLWRTNWEESRAEIISCNKTRWDDINMGSPGFKASLCISTPKIKTAPFRQVTYFLPPLRSFTYSTHAATWDKLTGPFLLSLFTLNLFKHVIHAHPSLLIHRVISPPCGSFVSLLIKHSQNIRPVQGRNISSGSKKFQTKIFLLRTHK